ncbi:MAG TPA: SAM-dependent chlorinase/fluorinase [Acidimicrobiales bacterium]|nr:SAM-dependent chlorinase/fluorinase [Acidimicrobiales bacterium]
MTTSATPAPRIAFLSDFGTADEFVGVVHAVLSAHAPSAARIDVTHHIPAHDIQAGALTLWRAAPWLAPGVILGVVDPGVGTERRAVAIEVAEAGTVLVGPDTGLLLPAAHRLGPVTGAVELPPEPTAPGATFAGRDIFAPAAGRAAAGAPLQDLGEPLDPATLRGEAVPEPGLGKAGEVDAQVLWVDHFGNAQLNATPAHTGTGPLQVHSPHREALLRVVPSYGAIAPDEVALVVDSYGYLSISAPRRSAAHLWGLHPGDAVRLRPDPPGHR